MSLCATIFVVLSEHDRKKKTLGRSEIPTLRVYFTLCYLMLTCLKGSISWTAHVRAKAQNLKNSAEYCKIDPAKKRQRLRAAKAAMAKKNDFWPETVQTRVVSNLQRTFLENNIFQSWLSAKFKAGCECSSGSDFAARSLSLEYRRSLPFLSLMN